MLHNFRVLVISDLGGGSGVSPPVSLGSCIGVTVLGCLRAPGSLGHIWLLLQTPHCGRDSENIPE